MTDTENDNIWERKVIKSDELAIKTIKDNKILYGRKSQEKLDLDIEDTLRYYIDDKNFDDYPIEIYIFKRLNPIPNVEQYADNLLNILLEELDNEYADPDNETTEPTQNMIDASLILAQTIKDEYTSWMCEPTGEVLSFSKEYIRRKYNL